MLTHGGFTMLVALLFRCWFFAVWVLRPNPWVPNGGVCDGSVLVSNHCIHHLWNLTWWMGRQLRRTCQRSCSNHPLLTTGLWQAALALGTAFLCEGCRASGGRAKPWLAAFNRLAFGINVAHPVVQFFVEAHTTLNDRVFSLFSWPTQIALVVVVTALPAVFVYILVQRPWALILPHCQMLQCHVSI